MRKLRQIILFGIFYFITAQCVLAQNKINLVLNAKQFRFNQDTSLVEIYYGYMNDQQNKISKLAFEITIANDNERVVHDIWGIENENSVSDSGRTKLSVDVLKYLLEEGKYRIQLIAKDLLNPQRIDSIEIRDYQVRTFKSDVISLSDIELSQDIQPVQLAKTRKFIKNRFEVVPNVLNYYNANNLNVYYYLEIYNLNQAFKGKFFHIKRTILDSQGLPVTEIPVYNKKKRIRGIDDVEVGMFNVAKLPSGKYNLHLAVVDSAGHAIAGELISFYVDNPQYVSQNQGNISIENQLKSSEIALIDISELDMYLGALKYLLPENEKKVVDFLDSEDSKRLYLYRYWKANDTRPETKTLEAFRDFVWKVQYANKNFSESQIKGWMTDRGRILIKYGMPSEIQYYPNVPDFKEFQAWSYDNIENGVVFIFGNIGSFGDLKLLHSTKTGELHNEAWLDLLKVSHGRTGIAEETMGMSAREYLRKIFRDNNLEWPRYLK